MSDGGSGNKVFHVNIIDLTEELQVSLKAKGFNLDLRFLYDVERNKGIFIRGVNQMEFDLENGINETREYELTIRLIESLGFSYDEAKRLTKPLAWSLREVLSPESLSRKLSNPITELVNDFDIGTVELLEMLKDPVFSSILKSELIVKLQRELEEKHDCKVNVDEVVEASKNDVVARYMVKSLIEKGLRFVKVGGKGLLIVVRGNYGYVWEDEDNLASSIASIYDCNKSGLLRAIKDALWIFAEGIEEKNMNPQGLLLFKNGVLDLRTLTFSPMVSEKQYVFTSMIDCELKPHYLSRLREMKLEDWEREVPRFLGLLRRLFPDEENFNKALEMLGALFIPSVVRKIFIVYGDPKTGKSALLSVLLEGFGRCFSTIAIEDLKDKFNYMLLGKYANITSEASDILVDEKLISVMNRLTGDSYIVVEEKHKPKIQVKNMLKLVIFTNEFPLLKKLDMAFLDRLYPIEVTGKAVEGERALESVVTEIIKEEKEKLVYFMLWCMLQVYDPATGKLTFKYNVDIEEKKELLLKKLNPVNAWIEECCVEEGYEPRKVLYASFVDWAKKKGKRVLSKHQFYSILRSMGYVEATIDGVQCFKGLSLKTETRKTLGDYITE